MKQKYVEDFKRTKKETICSCSQQRFFQRFRWIRDDTNKNIDHEDPTLYPIEASGLRQAWSSSALFVFRARSLRERRSRRYASTYYLYNGKCAMHSMQGFTGCSKWLSFFGHYSRLHRCNFAFLGNQYLHIRQYSYSTYVYNNVIFSYLFPLLNNLRFPELKRRYFVHANNFHSDINSLIKFYISY